MGSFSGQSGNSTSGISSSGWSSTESQPDGDTVWHMLTDNADYQDLGGDYFTKQDPERAMRRIIRQANALGLTVRFDPIPDVA